MRKSYFLTTDSRLIYYKHMFENNLKLQKKINHSQKELKKINEEINRRVQNQKQSENFWSDGMSELQLKLLKREFEEGRNKLNLHDYQTICDKLKAYKNTKDNSIYAEIQLNELPDFKNISDEQLVKIVRKGFLGSGKFLKLALGNDFKRINEKVTQAERDENFCKVRYFLDGELVELQIVLPQEKIEEVLTRKPVAINCIQLDKQIPIHELIVNGVLVYKRPIFKQED